MASPLNASVIAIASAAILNLFISPPAVLPGLGRLFRLAPCRCLSRSTETVMQEKTRFDARSFAEPIYFLKLKPTLNAGAIIYLSHVAKSCTIKGCLKGLKLRAFSATSLQVRRGMQSNNSGGQQ